MAMTPAERQRKSKADRKARGMVKIDAFVSPIAAVKIKAIIERDRLKTAKAKALDKKREKDLQVAGHEVA